MNTPTMIPGTVEMVSVEWILKNSQGSVDAVTDEHGNVDYLKMVQRKGSDNGFSNLVSTIMTKGFRVPIVLCLNYKPWGDSEPKQVVHGNGHHRMTAALLLFLDEIPVYWSDHEATRDYMVTKKSESEPVDYTDDLMVGLWPVDEWEGPWGQYNY